MARLLKPLLFWLLRRSPYLIGLGAAGALAFYGFLVAKAVASPRNLLWVSNTGFVLVLVTFAARELVANLSARPQVQPRETPVEAWILDAGAPPGRKIRLTLPVHLIGRAPECDVRIDRPGVSRRHCRLVRRGSSYHVEDLGSTAGTFLNGKAVESATGPLTAGDLIALGRGEEAAAAIRLGPSREGSV